MKQAEQKLHHRHGLLNGDTFETKSGDVFKIIDCIDPWQDASGLIDRYMITGNVADTSSAPRYILRLTAYDHRLVSLKRLGQMLPKTIGAGGQCLLKWEKGCKDIPEYSTAQARQGGSDADKPVPGSNTTPADGARQNGG